MEPKFLYVETIFDYKGDSIGVTGFQNDKCYVQILDKKFERPIQCKLQGNLKENRLYLSRGNPQMKPYHIKKFLQIMDLEGNIIFSFDRNLPILTSIVPSTNITFSSDGNIMFWGVQKKQDEKQVEVVKILDKNGKIILHTKKLTNQKEYYYPYIAINEAGYFLVCYTQDLTASPNREWIFKCYDAFGEINWEYLYKGPFVRNVTINQKCDLFFIVDNESFQINKQELYIVECKGEITKIRALDRMYTDIYYKGEGVLNLRRRLFNEEDYNIEFKIK